MGLIFIAFIVGLLVYLFFRGLSLLIPKKNKTVDTLLFKTQNKYIELHKSILSQYDDYYQYVGWCKQNNQEYILDFNMFNVIKSNKI